MAKSLAKSRIAGSSVEVEMVRVHFKALNGVESAGIRCTYLVPRESIPYPSDEVFKL